MLRLGDREAVAGHDDAVWAASRIIAASSACTERTLPYSPRPPGRGLLAPKPPKSTLASERFIALHMIA